MQPPKFQITDRHCMALFTKVQHLCTFNIVTLLIYHLLPNVWKASYTISASIYVGVPYLRPYSTDKFISCWTGSLAVVLSLWRRDGNRMDWYRVSTVDVPESLITSGTRGPWQQQRCDSLHCHEEWWGSVPPNVVFCWALDEGGAAGMCSSRQRLPSALEVQHGVVLPHQCHMPQWTSHSQHIV